MGETLPPVATRFNKSLRVESRAERHHGVDDPAADRSPAPGGCRP